MMESASHDSHASRRLTALFSDGPSAERAYQACVARGYEVGEVNVIMSDDTRKQLVSDGSDTTTLLADRTSEGGEMGGPKGGRAEILVTIFSAVGAALVLPALGFALAGPIAAALTGAGAAGLAAGLIATLSDWGVPEDRIHRYEAGITEGGILMMVDARSEEDARELERQWRAIGAREVAR